MENNIFNILWDMDAVSADWDLGLKNGLIQKFPGFSFKEPQDREHWWYSKNHPEHLRAEIDAVAFVPGFFENLAVKEGAMEAMKWALKQGFSISICTSPLWTKDETIVARCISEKVRWLSRHVGSFATLFRPDADVQVVFAHDKTLMHGDVLIDDNPEISGKMVPSWKQLLFDEDYLFSKHLTLPRINWSNYKEVLMREYELWLQNKKAIPN